MATKSPALHTDRIKEELIKAGATKYTLLRAELRKLPSLIHKDEIIGGIVYGRTEGGTALLVATDKRVVYVDEKVFYDRADEINYDVVSGVSLNKQGRYSGVVLHTRLGDFKFKFVRTVMAQRFVQYVEDRQLESTPQPKADVPIPTFAVEQADSPIEFSQKAHTFLMAHDIATLATLAPNGMLQAAAVYYVTDKNSTVYIVTKSKTSKAQNITTHPQVAFMVYDTSSMQTIQIEGLASVEDDPKICKRIYDTILRPRFQGSHAEMPPIMYLPAGDYEVIVIKPVKYKLSDYKTQK
jgi:general stress protein 26